MTRSKRTGLLLFFVFLVLAFRLRQEDLEFVVEPDFSWTLIEIWKNFFSTFDISLLPQTAPYVYLDGQFIAYGAFDGLLRLASSHIVALRSYFPNDLSYALGAALLANILAYAAACTIFYAAMYRLTGYISISVLMAIGLFLAPQMVEINMGRVDFLVTFPLMVIFYCSCVLAIGQERKRHAVVLGLALAFAATIKLNGLFLGVFPAIAALAAFRFTTIKQLVFFAAISFASFLPAYLLLMLRYFYQLTPLGIMQHYKDSVAQVSAWSWLTVGASRLYYNIDLMMGHGTAFIVLYLACAAATLVIAIVHRSRPAIFLALLFAVLSVAAAAASLKYQRGGYHLLPVFFAVVGFGAARLLSSSAHRLVKIAAIAVGGFAFASGIFYSSGIYATAVAKRKSEIIGIQLLKREPRDWLRSHVPPGTTICTQTDSSWTLPPLDGFHVTDGPLAIAYLDPAALATSAPPGLEEVRMKCPIVMTSDSHRNFYRNIFNLITKRAPADAAAKWDAFFAALNERYPPTVFRSPVALRVKVKEIYLNDLRDK
jgi:hypothetical protein